MRPTKPTRRRCFNGSTVREPWLSDPDTSRGGGQEHASMGPRFANRGYRVGGYPGYGLFQKLQWVHGSRTVVIALNKGCSGTWRKLQWVHGSRTVVIVIFLCWRHIRRNARASMGPRFANRGYRCHGNCRRRGGMASMGPRFANRGYRLTSQSFR